MSTPPTDAWAAALDAAKRNWLADRSDSTLDHHIRLVADSVVWALFERGYQIVPIDPTPAMTNAAGAAMSPGRRPTDAWVSVAQKHAYRYMAMLAAAPAFPPEARG